MVDLPTGTVTFLFTDIEGSTKLLQELGDGYGLIQDAHSAILREAIAEGSGREIRTEGDAFFAVFPTPRGAVEAAVGAQRALAGHTWPHGRTLRVRMGVHTGEGTLGGDDYLGLDVNRAARIAAAGHGGQVLVSDATRALVEHNIPEGVALRDLGPHRLKDLEHAEHLHDLVIEGLPSEFPALRSLDARPNNLPVALTSFVGREQEIGQIEQLLTDTRLLTLTGPGGTGKTRMALEVAARSLPRYADGAFFVDLSPIGDAALVPSAVATALGAQPKGDESLLDAATRHLADKELLLVVDNFEHVVEEAGALGAILRAAPRVTGLVTSRVVLRLPGEREFPVPPLALPDPARLPPVDALSQFEAVALFIDRARAVRPDFEVTNDSAPAVAGICARLDGLPLAIELAASRVRLLSPQEILARLEDRLALLTTGSPHLPERQRTLRGAIAWSHDLLDDGERDVFARMSIFAGGATVEAAEAVTAGEGTDVLEGLGSLVEKSLLRRTETFEGETQFSMLETIREFAREQLAQGPDAEGTARRHAEFFADLAEEAGPNLEQDVAGWLPRCEREHDNFRASLRWSIDSAERGIAERTAAGLWRFWQHLGYLREGGRWLDEILALPGPADASRAAALTAAGGLAYWQGDYEPMERHYSEALDIYRSLGDRRGEMEALYNMSFIPLMAGGDTDKAIEMLEQVAAMARDLGDRRTLGRATGGMAYALTLKGDFAAAIEPMKESIALSGEIGDRFHVADAVGSLGQIYRLMGDAPRAREQYLQALDLLEEIGNLPLIVSVLHMLASTASIEGNHERAARLWGAAVAAREAVGAAAPVSLMRLGDPIAAAEEALGRQAVEELLAEGGAMDLDKAVAYARES
jgi:predicted ATPase/class 3 adenylate cyclase